MKLRTLVAGLALLVAPPAFAEIDGGTYYLRTPADQGSHKRGSVSVTETPDGAVESWTVCKDVVDPSQRLDTELSISPVDWDFGSETTDCADTVSYDIHVRYEDVLADDLVDVARRAAAGARTERVLIEGETVGWRVVTAIGGLTRETWIMTADYAPPTPSVVHARDGAFARGWSRAYVATVTIEPADGADVAEEIEDYAAAGDFDGARLARASFSTKPATRSAMRRTGLRSR